MSGRLGFQTARLEFPKNPTVQFENPTVQTWGRLRRIFQLEQYFRYNLWEKVLAGSWSRPWRLMAGNYQKSWNLASGISFCEQFRCENLAARMFKMHMTCRYGSVVKPFQVIFYNPGCFAKMMAGNYIGDFFGFRMFFEKSNRAVWTPRRPAMGEITAHLSAGTIPPGNVILKSFSGTVVGPVDDAKFWKLTRKCIRH